jgi:tRNA nucleotidyltransferase (CCA-adding enzyme)
MDVPPPAELLERVRSLSAAGPLFAALPDASNVYLVGGAVRDLLLGLTPHELDLVVDGDAASIAAALGGELRVHDRFGTSTVTLGDFTYDIARSRRETYAHPGALPEVTPAPLDVDLLRRDFTVNALAASLAGPEAGVIRAPKGALDDLEKGRLRVLHDDSFRDDPTRMLRLVRYASRLGFEVEPHTRELLDQALAAGALSTISGSRTGAELRLLASEPDPIAALVSAGELGLDRAIDPRLHLANPELAARAMTLLPADGRRDRLVLAVAAGEIPEHELAALLESLAFEAPDRDAIVAAATRAPGLARRLSAAQRPSEIAAAIGPGAGPELVALAGAIGAEHEAGEWLTRLRKTKLEITGADLIASGVPQGPAVGRGLAAALAAKLDGQAQDRDAELAQALRAADGSG